MVWADLSMTWQMPVELYQLIALTTAISLIWQREHLLATILIERFLCTGWRNSYLEWGGKKKKKDT